MFNEWYTNPEAFSEEYEEYRALMAELARPEETEVEVSEGCEWADLTDIVRAHEESLTDEELVEYERQILRFDFPYEM